MTRIANWPTRAMYIGVALALVLGMAIVPAATPAMAQTLPFITEPEDPIAYNVKGATHKVCIDLGSYGDAEIDWYMVAGVDITPADVVVLSPTGPNPWSGNASYDETVKTIGTMDNVLCIVVRAMRRGDIHIFVDVIHDGLPGGKMTLHTEKKWGEIHRSDLDVDATTDGVQNTMATVDIPAGATGIYRQKIIDMITADFLQVPVPVPVDGAVVHWWLLEDSPEYKAKIRELMQYLADTDPDGFYEDYTASGKYLITDPEMGGKQPWEWINDWVTDASDPKYADPDIFEWGTLDPCGTIDTVLGTGDWYAWNESEDGIAEATIWVNEEAMEVCKTYKIMIVVLVSYPGGTTDQEDPFNGENRVAVQIGQKSYHKARTPLTAQVKTPQLRWASEKLVLEKDWGVEAESEWGYYWVNTQSGASFKQVCEGEDLGPCTPMPPLGDFWELAGRYFDARIYVSIYNLELGSIGNLEPINDMATFSMHTPSGSIVAVPIDSIGLPAGAQQVIAPLGGAYVFFSGEQLPTGVMASGDSISRCILSTEQSGQADVNASLYEIRLEFISPMDGMVTDGAVALQDREFSLSYMWVEGPIVNHGFLAYFLNFEDVTLSDETPPSSLQNLLPEADDAHVAVQVRGYFDYRHSHLPATTRKAEVIDVPDSDIDILLPAGRYVLPDDWALLAGTRNVSLRPNFDLMDRADLDTINSIDPLGPYDTEVRTTDPPGEAEFPTIGPFSTLQQWSVEGKWVAAATVPTSAMSFARNTVVPDGNIDRWDAPMPPALVIFDIVYETEDASLSQLLKTDLEGYGYTAGKPRIFHSPYYAVEIPASPYIPPGYFWQSWTAWGVPGWISVDGPYPFWTDLEMETRWAYEDPIDDKDVEVYSDNHGIAAVAIDALADVGYVTITATADFPYTPKMGKYGPRVSDEISAAWGEPLPLVVNPHFTADKIEVEVGETVTFTNETMGGTPPYLAAHWDFDGDGVTDSTLAVQTGETVTWEYAAPGLYNVRLTIFDVDETRTETRWYYITVTGEGPGPVPDEPSPEDGLASIADELVIVYYYAGAGVWDVYWPEFDMDTIVTLELGEIYLIYVNSNCTLQYGTKSYDLTGPDWNFVYWQGS